MGVQGEPLQADYLVYGAGAMGMAFVDALLKERSVKVIVVDKHAQPGGHWNDAYPYVRLHQPSRFYGVNSRILERSSDNLELASKNEVLAYFEAVMDGFIKSGQVSYYPMCIAEDAAGHTFQSLVEPDKSYTVTATAKVVDSTYMKVEVPSVSSPAEAGRFQVDDGVRLVPLNGIATVGNAHERYVVIGAGKTGMDACLWLLRNSVNADRIHWVMPRDSWIVRRELFGGDMPNECDLSALLTITAAQTQEQYFEAMEKARFLTRLDTSIQPQQYKCATCSDEETAQLRRISNVIRMGRVKRITNSQLELNAGVLSMPANTLYVDCSTDGLVTRPSVPVFQGNILRLQPVSSCQQVFSAALLGFIETLDCTDEEKNGLSAPVPHPDVPKDMFVSQLQTELNLKLWQSHPKIARWLKQSRLFGLSKPEQQMTKMQMLTFLVKNIANLRQLAKAEEQGLETLRRLSKL